MFCPKCLLHHLDGNFCRFCGTPTVFSKFPCPFCKAPNLVMSSFCEHCGKPIQEAGQAFIKHVEGGK